MAAVNDDIDVKWESTEDAIKEATEQDSDLSDIAAKLDKDVTLSPDRDLNLDTESHTSDSSASYSGGSHRDPEDNHTEESGKKSEEKLTNGDIKSANGKPVANGNGKISEKSRRPGDESFNSKKSLGANSKAPSDTDSSKSGKKDSCAPSSKNPFKMLKKLTKFDKPAKKTDFRSEFSAVVVDRLPQVFVVKYLGHRIISGVAGLHHVRKPVDEMVKEVKSKIDDNSEVQLPLLYVVVSPKGLDLREHKSNKVKDVAPLGMMPIDFISYGVQDIKFWRVFVCIVVRELSSRSRTATCHAFLCDSSHNGRKMALALGASFNMYSKQLRSDGKVHNFQVELRPPDQLADALEVEA